MWNFLLGSFQLGGRARRQIKARITLLLIHFCLLVVIQSGIQLAVQTILHPANAIFGLVWMIGAALIIWVRGGLPLDTLLGFYVASKNRTAQSMTRVLIGFFTVESFVNICFCVFPFHSNIAAFGLILVAVVSYFMFRHMAGQPINWAGWVWFPMLNIGVALGAILWSAYSKSNPGVSALALPSINTKTLLTICVVVFLVLLVSGKPKTGGSHDH